MLDWRHNYVTGKTKLIEEVKDSINYVMAFWWLSGCPIVYTSKLLAKEMVRSTPSSTQHRVGKLATHRILFHSLT
jgi:hypothetical protein